MDHIEDLRNTIRKVKQAHPFNILAWVVLPSPSRYLDVTRKRWRLRNALDVD
ncbi:MAG: hypothetical protein LBI35_03500 [Burkholderiales bacterium]|nr:hypothetical protein [Burkholderiales bacterium]